MVFRQKADFSHRDMIFARQLPQPGRGADSRCEAAVFSGVVGDGVGAQGHDRLFRPADEDGQDLHFLRGKALERVDVYPRPIEQAALGHAAREYGQVVQRVDLRGLGGQSFIRCVNQAQLACFFL